MNCTENIIYESNLIVSIKCKFNSKFIKIKKNRGKFNYKRRKFAEVKILFQYMKHIILAVDEERILKNSR